MNDQLTRRSFMQVVAGTGATLALGSFSSVACAADNSTKGETFAPNAFLSIDPDGSCTVTVTRSDMGQGIRTTFAMLVAEELDADWKKVKVLQSPGDSTTYGSQGTGGSGSTRGMNARLRNIGATARAMLVSAAAKQWGVDVATCRTENGKVLSSDGKSVGYGGLTAVAKLMPVPEGVPLKDKSAFKIIGKAKNRVDNTDVVTGKAMYGYDVHVDGMLYAVCLRPPTFGASQTVIDDKAARKVVGVVDVIPIPSGIAVIAKNTWAALKGREALQVTWTGGNASVSTASLRAGLKKAVSAHKEISGGKTIEANYELPYLAHATMEAVNAVADVRADSCEVWTGSQSPDGAQNQIARNLGMAKEKVVVHNMLLGGGFGRKFSNEWVGEAVELSKRMKKPVKLLWTRECDIQHDIYRPMSEHAMRAGVDASGNPTGWSHQYLQAPGRGGGDYSNGTYLPYDIPNAGMKSGGFGSPVPTGPWRSVEHSQIIVANECFVDELAHAAGQDPYEFRKKLAKNDRLKKVLESAAKKAKWGTPMAKGSGRGIACFEGYGSCIAHVVEVTIVDKEIKVTRMVAVVDVGTSVNPRGVEAQVQGAFMDGVSTALKAAVTIEKGGVV
ncbi:MAG: molybdopterin-dependent oxidoreductase, partial [Armatimonadetes bacterium]|nr:molybdopterin-dependent oxidoreductase [Armatimonadota bacterium]